MGFGVRRHGFPDIVVPGSRILKLSLHGTFLENWRREQ
jgi:hypothetical protein